jgi:hypothetical protein
MSACVVALGALAGEGISQGDDDSFDRLARLGPQVTCRGEHLDP